MADAQQTLMDALMGRANLPNMLLRQRGTMGGASNPLFMGPPTTPPGQMPLPPPGQMGPGPPPAGTMAGPAFAPPGYEEWQTQGPSMGMPGGEPSQPTPQINDIQQLFNNSIMRNAPTSNPMGGQFLRDITLGGHLAGGNDI